MSIFKTNKFFRVIKHFILCLPLMFVLGSSLYAIVNPNAKDSYYGDTINESEMVKVNFDDLQSGSYYVYQSDAFTYQDVSSKTLYVEDVYNNESLVSCNQIRFYNSGSTNSLLFYSDAQYVGSINLNTTNAYVSFKYINAQYVGIAPLYDNFYVINYFEYSFLSNAFEYGLYQFTTIGFGQFDFISLFNGIFTTSLNNVYATFINDYINYYLFVEMVYFTPWVIHMFIHFAYDLGDYFTSSFKRNKKEND